MGLQAMLERVVRTGDLTLKLPGGATLKLGDGSGPPLIARVTTAGWAARIAAKPGLGVGEAYMDVQDQLNELLEDDRLTLARDAEETHGTAQKAVGLALEHLDAARQVLAVLETGD